MDGQTFQVLLKPLARGVIKQALRDWVDGLIEDTWFKSDEARFWFHVCGMTGNNGLQLNRNEVNDYLRRLRFSHS